MTHVSWYMVHGAWDRLCHLCTSCTSSCTTSKPLLVQRNLLFFNTFSYFVPLVPLVPPFLSSHIHLHLKNLSLVWVKLTFTGTTGTQLFLLTFLSFLLVNCWYMLVHAGTRSYLSLSPSISIAIFALFGLFYPFLGHIRPFLLTV